MTTLVNQPTKVPTRKKLWQDSTQFLIVAGAFGLGFAGVDIPPGLEGLAVGVAGTFVGYYIRDAA